MYRRCPADSQPSGDGAGARRFVLPPGTPAFATISGTVSHAGRISTGLRCWVTPNPSDPSGWSLGFFHLSSLDVVSGQVVKPTDRVGTVGHSPSGNDPMHLHLELHPNIGHHKYSRSKTLDSAALFDGGAVVVPSGTGAGVVWLIAGLGLLALV